MTVRLSHDVFCDKCGVWFTALITSGADVRINAARRKAKLKGWQTRRNADNTLLDICSDCVKELAAAAERD